VLDRTITPMGGRRLRQWLLQPLRDLSELKDRQQFIADLLQEPDVLAALNDMLKSIRDMERATGRLSQASGNGRDLFALKVSLQQIPSLKRELQRLLDRLAFGANRQSDSPEPLGQRVQNQLREMPHLVDKLDKALLDDPPFTLKD